jgi:hypothetical protein
MKTRRFTWICSLLPMLTILGATDAIAQFMGGPPQPAAKQHHAAGDRVRAALAADLKPSGLDFTEEPLENVVNFLQDEYRLPIQLDLPALENLGLTADEPVTVSLREISLRSALQLVLSQKRLAYVVRDGYLLITTRDKAAHEPQTVVYNVADLIGDDDSGQLRSTLIDTIRSCVAYDTWALNDKGPGQIKSFQTLLIVSQTAEVHVEIERLLATMRQSLDLPQVATVGELIEPQLAEPLQVEEGQTEFLERQPATPTPASATEPGGADPFS